MAHGREESSRPKVAARSATYKAPDGAEKEANKYWNEKRGFSKVAKWGLVSFLRQGGGRLAIWVARRKAYLFIDFSIFHSIYSIF